MRLLGLIDVACAWPLLVSAAPHALAAPDIPDINSLIDDSGPLPRETGDLTAIPNDLRSATSSLLTRILPLARSSEANAEGAWRRRQQNGEPIPRRRRDRRKSRSRPRHSARTGRPRMRRLRHWTNRTDRPIHIGGNHP